MLVTHRTQHSDRGEKKKKKKGPIKLDYPVWQFYCTNSSFATFFFFKQGKFLEQHTLTKFLLITKVPSFLP